MKMTEWRCSNCRKLLAKVKILDGVAEVKCDCGTMNVIQITKPEDQGSKPYVDRITGYRKKS